MTARHVVVAGAGVTGLLTAFQLAKAGLSVTLADPAPLGDNASGVAAGMLAPALEAALDDAARPHFDLLRQGRDAWTDLAALLGGEAAIGLDRCGSVYIDLPGQPRAADGVAATWRGLGADVTSAPGPAVGRTGVWGSADALAWARTSDDWRLDPLAALKTLREAGAAAGVQLIEAAVQGFDGAAVRLSNGEAARADRLIVASGAESADLAPELARLAPIKGHILRYAGVAGVCGGAGQPILRDASAYATRVGADMVVGATMEQGVRHRRIDPATVERLHRAAVRLYPALAGHTPAALTGVRAAAPDGLPLAGRSARSGVLVAAGMRRNGWLLAPLAAEVVVAATVGAPAPAMAALFSPARF